MPDDPDRVGSALLGYLSDADLAVLLGVGDEPGTGSAAPGSRPGARGSWLLLPSSGATWGQGARAIAAIRRQPALVLDALGAPGAAARVLERGDARRAEPGRFSLVSPFLVFAAAIELTAADLAAHPYRA